MFTFHFEGFGIETIYAHKIAKTGIFPKNLKYVNAIAPGYSEAIFLKERNTRYPVAVVKISSRKGLQKGLQYLAQNEIDILMLLQKKEDECATIVQLLQVFEYEDLDAEGTSFPGIILEWAGGNIFPNDDIQINL